MEKNRDLIQEKNILEYITNVNVGINEEYVLERILDWKRWPKKYPDGMSSISAIKEDGSYHQDFYDADGNLNSMDCIKCYEEGYTLVFGNVGSLSKDLWIIQQFLNESFGRYMNCNLYFGTGKKSVSFGKHWHEYDVIVKNIYGESKWIVGEKELILKNQNCIYFDRYVEHQVIQINNAKLSLTCNID